MLTEQLESRQFLSVASGGYPLTIADPNVAPVSVKLSRTGTLFITGTSMRDTISLTSIGGGPSLGRNGIENAKLRVMVKIITKLADGKVGGYEAAFDQSLVKRIDIQGGGGNDFLDVNTGITGRTVLHGGKGDDRLQTTGKRGSLFGDSGNDVLTSNTSVSKLAFNDDDGSTEEGERVVPLSYNLLNGGDGADIFRSRGGDDSIVGGAGADRFEPLEAGIAITNGLTLPAVLYAAGTKFGTSRVAISDVGVIAAEPSDQDDVQVYVGEPTA